MHQSGRPTASSPWGQVAGFAYARELADDETSQLEQLCSAIADVLHVRGACVTSTDGHHLATAEASLADLDTLQYADGSGPGSTAITTGDVVCVDDTTTDRRWPTFLEAATAAGFRAILSVPLARHHEVNASVSAYSTRVRDWSDDDQAAAVVLCAIATTCVAGSRRLRDQALVVSQLQQALDSRVVIEQAKGVLAALQRIPPDEAFELMRGHARRRGIPVREVARAVVRHGFRPPRGPWPRPPSADDTGD